MIYAITFENRHQHEGLLEKMFRARHRIYVEGRKWRELAKADGREIDSFDSEKAIYFLSLGKGGDLHGGLRLIPSTSPHMLNTLFPELCNSKPVPQGAHIWELSRVFVCHNERFDEEGLLLKGKLMCGMMEFAEQYGISEIVSVADTYFLPRLLASGLDARPLGLPKPYQSGEMVAIQIILRPGDLQKAQSYYGIPGSVLLSSPLPTSIPAEQIPVETFELETALDKGNDFISEFKIIMPLLTTKDPVKLVDAERQLDELTKRVRRSLMDEQGIRNSGGALN